MRRVEITLFLNVRTIVVIVITKRDENNFRLVKSGRKFVRSEGRSNFQIRSRIYHVYDFDRTLECCTSTVDFIDSTGRKKESQLTIPRSLNNDHDSIDSLYCDRVLDSLVPLVLVDKRC